MKTLTLKTLSVLASAMVLTGCGSKSDVEVKFDIAGKQLQQLDGSLQGGPLVIKKIYFTDEEVAELATLRNDFDEIQGWVRGNMDVNDLEGNVFKTILADDLAMIESRYADAEKRWEKQVEKINADRDAEIGSMMALREQAQAKIDKYDAYVKPSQFAYNKAKVALTTAEYNQSESWDLVKSKVMAFVVENGIELSRSERRNVIGAFDKREIYAGDCEQAYAEEYMKKMGKTRTVKYCRGIKVTSSVSKHANYTNLVTDIEQAAKAYVANKASKRALSVALDESASVLKKAKSEVGRQVGNRARLSGVVNQMDRKIARVMTKYERAVSVNAKNQFMSDQFGGFRSYVFTSAEKYVSKVNQEMLAKKVVERVELHSFAQSFTIDANKGKALLIAEIGNSGEFVQFVSATAEAGKALLLDIKNFKQRTFITLAKVN